MTRRLGALIALATLAGCATPTGYHRLGAEGGYEDFPRDATTYVVSYKGNAATTRERVAMYLHYRCAELTIASGQEFFTVVATESQDLTEQWTTPGYATSTTTGVPYGGRYPYGGTRDRTTTYTPPQTMTAVRPGLSATIRMGSGAKPEGAFDAREVVRLLGPRIGVAPSAQPAPALAPLAPAPAAAPAAEPAPAAPGPAPAP
jgi:hypothetical protein